MTDYAGPADGLSILIRASLGGEQSFQLAGNVLTFQSEGPNYGWSSGQVQLSPEQVEAIYSLLQKVRVGPIPTEPTVGLDGETTTITVRRGHNRVELEFWDAPKPWRPIEKLVKMVREAAKLADEEDTAR